MHPVYQMKFLFIALGAFMVMPNSPASHLGLLFVSALLFTDGQRPLW